MAKTEIAWTDFSWNPLRASYRDPDYFDTDQGVGQPGEVHLGWHCERVSPGCQNCYAERLNEKRFGSGLPYNRKSRDMVEPFLDGATLVKPLSWRKPRKVFVCSMTDLFGEWVPDEWIARVFAMMASARQHTFQVLTKRPARMRAFLAKVAQCEHGWLTHNGSNPVSFGGTGVIIHDGAGWPLPNVWLGTSVEDQVRADERIPELLECPAAVRFLSCEPLLGPVDVGYYIGDRGTLPDNDPNIDWVIVGGESGPGARPCDLAWIREIVEQCQDAGVAVFYKQGGASNRCPHDRKGGHLECFPEDLQIREYPNAV